MDKEEKPILALIQQINAGEINPKDLKPEIRQQVVEVLILEGYSDPQLAQILQVSDKTIKRDTKTINERNGLTPDADLVKRLVGGFVMKAEAHRSFLMRIARSREGTVGERSLSEYYAWKVEKEKVEKLQLLGFLPLIPHHVLAEVYNRGNDDAATFADLKKELLSIEGVADKEGILDEVTKEKIRLLQLKIEKEEIKVDINKLNNDQPKMEESNGQPE